MPILSRTKIEWADYTWNPVIGCKRGCSYCYAKRMNDRFKWIPDFTKLSYREHKFPKNGIFTEKPGIVFVGSMSDICYWEDDWVYNVIETCLINPEFTFMFLTKDPKFYSDWGFTKNCMLGYTITNFNAEALMATSDFINLNKCERKFISLEPLLSSVVTINLGEFFEKIIVGAMTGPGAIKPKKEWIESIKSNILKDVLFLKDSIKPYFEEGYQW